MAISTELGEEKQVSIPQGTIHYREKGQGHPIVFIHGFLVNGDLWRQIAPKLNNNRCIFPDLPLGCHLPGSIHANADLTIDGVIELIRNFINALNLEEAPTLIAVDSGGAMTQILISRYPEIASRLVFFNCDCFENFPPTGFGILPFGYSYIPGFAWLAAKLLKISFVFKILLMMLVKNYNNVDPAVTRGWVRYLDAPEIMRDTTKFVSTASPKYTLEAAKHLKNFRGPVKIIWGKNDFLFPLSYGKKLADAFQKAELEVIDNSYCFVMEDQPEKAAQAIKEFLQ